MFLDILPDLLRGSTTTICLLFLFPVLSRPRLKIKKSILIAIFITIIDLVICSLFYLNKNYTGVVYYTLFAYLLLIISCKFLFSDKLLQWCFNCVTVLNVYAIIVIASYFLAYLFPHPNYAITVIRIILFAITIICFRKFLRPLYLEVSENWAAFLLPTTGILANYLYIILSLGDVEISMSRNFFYFCFLTLVTVLTYIATIFSLKSLRQKYILREENIKRQANEQLLGSEIVSYEGSINSAKQTRHDIRHHNAILIEYLNSGDINAAKNYLKLYDDNIKNSAFKEFSKNPIANAVFRIYDRRARELNIEFVVCAEADGELNNRLTDIGIIFSNIFENALTACKQCSFVEKHIYYSSLVQNGSVLIEIRNSVEGRLVFENGFPVTTKSGGGTGLMSVKSIVQKNSGMLDLRQVGDEFFTRIILPTPSEK